MIEKLGERISARRQELGWSLGRLAREAGTQKSHILNLEQGKAVNPSVMMVMRIAQALSIPMAELIGDALYAPTVTQEERDLLDHIRNVYASRKP